MRPLPPALSTFAPEVDRIFAFVHGTAAIALAVVVIALVVLAVRHRRRRGVAAAPPSVSRAWLALELAWAVAPVVPFALMFHWGFQAYLRQSIAPDDAYVVHARARQWAWEFEHPNGITEDNELHVPAGRAVRLVLSSSDVIHSFFAPELRVKRDAVPGTFTSLWFEAIERPDVPLEGDLSVPDARRIWYRAPILCAELCGASGRWGPNAGHATMSAEILVMRPEDFDAWVSTPGCLGFPPATTLEWGQQLFSMKGCTACHAREEGAPPLAGPSLHALFGREVRMASGEVVIADEAYVREAILQPHARVVAGFDPVMPRIRMSDEQLDALLEYLRTL
ncbi:cytochrome c oxidase subunit II [Sandaracinus amylolyticus]|uniref:cytochrome c oxidase subunit II n=1 Tax=Sandaracinus amylolyticus TaxID=927083 RepID=UPI001F40E0C2|nr:cytochrome c oxidase subunit II [Sandaracinus amylolyticus]UJR81154.1 Cytochrome c oxidase polypeptide II [Sandaracinus amylolyticus]